MRAGRAVEPFSGPSGLGAEGGAEGMRAFMRLESLALSG